MKKYITLSLILFSTLTIEAQIIDVKKEAKEKGTHRVNRNIEDGIDKGLNKIENGIKSIFKKKKKKSKEKEDQNPYYSDKKQQENKKDTNTESENKSSVESKQNKKIKPTVVWNKFDFIPGETVIFEDSPSINEENGEFPSRWGLVKGQVEIANVNGESVLMFVDGNPEIIPYLKNSKEDYLPEVFTIEFDFYKPKKGNRISVYLFDTKNQRKMSPSSMYMDISSVGVSEKLEKVNGEIPNLEKKDLSDARWIHVSIAYTKGKLKVYMDDTRVINIPHYSGNPSGLTLQAYWADLGDDLPFYFKNIRIAKGGVKYYDRVLSEGKIIVNGIRFDVNKASLKSESMGPINKIYKMMVKNTDLNFSVEGHTDADGKDNSNMLLSKERAKVVMDKLITMGIDASRLKYNGFGESKPIDNNSTAEGKANNRRVEFVKF